MAKILGMEIQVGDVVEVEEGVPIIVKSVREVGAFVRLTAFAHLPTDCWYVGKTTSVTKGALTFEVEQSNWEYVRTFVQLPLPFPEGVL